MLRRAWSHSTLRYFLFTQREHGREKVCADLSMGGMLPAAAARLSVGSRCEKLRNVAYQSAIWTIPLLTVPRTAGGRNPPLTKAATLMPPSKRLYLRVAQWIVQTLAAFISVVSTGVRTSRPSSASCWRRSRRGRPARRCYTAAALLAAWNRIPRTEENGRMARTRCSSP